MNSSHRKIDKIYVPQKFLHTQSGGKYPNRMHTSPWLLYIATVEAEITKWRAPTFTAGKRSWASQLEGIHSVKRSSNQGD